VLPGAPSLKALAVSVGVVFETDVFDAGETLLGAVGTMLSGSVM
jgi:hypothetical protein